MRRLIVSTRNAHKLSEIRDVLGTDWEVRGVGDCHGFPEVHESSPTFRGNAEAKSIELAHWLVSQGPEILKRLGGLPMFVLADDSGLEVDFLGGAPGVHSARYAALETGATGNSTDMANNQKLLNSLSGVAWSQRKARFRCALALLEIADDRKISQPTFFEGVCEGHIREVESGAAGFGYDPLFEPEGVGRTFAELTAEEKNQMSHRSRALSRFVRQFFSNIQEKK